MKKLSVLICLLLLISCRGAKQKELPWEEYKQATAPILTKMSNLETHLANFDIDSTVIYQSVEMKNAYDALPPPDLRKDMHELLGKMTTSLFSACSSAVRYKLHGVQTDMDQCIEAGTRYRRAKDAFWSEVKRSTQLNP